MSFTLTIDGHTWRSHLDHTRQGVLDATGHEVVGVVKGNGYGLGQGNVVREVNSMGSQYVAVGTVFEALGLLADSRADIVVLEPYEPRDLAAQQCWSELAMSGMSARVVRTVASDVGLRSALAEDLPGRILFEARTSMYRFGFDADTLTAVLADPDILTAATTGRMQIIGLSVHLPMVDPARQSRVTEAMNWGKFWLAACASVPEMARPTNGLWVSHLSDAELRSVAFELPGVSLRARVGTRLWLGSRGAFTAAGTVQAVHGLTQGANVGYRQRSGPKGSTVLVVSGGTAHGIGLSAPTPAATLRQRAVAVGTGVLDSTGRALSPFTWQGERCWFAEPPHQHHSMLWLPRGVGAPIVGDQIPADVRFTTTRFDAVLGLD